MAQKIKCNSVTLSVEAQVMQQIASGNEVWLATHKARRSMHANPTPTPPMILLQLESKVDATTNLRNVCIQNRFGFGIAYTSIQLQRVVGQARIFRQRNLLSSAAINIDSN
jgi:hypothetical protein